MLHALAVVDLSQPEALFRVLGIDRLYADRFVHVEVCLCIGRQIVRLIRRCINKLDAFARVEYVKVSTAWVARDLANVEEKAGILGCDHDFLLLRLEV